MKKRGQVATKAFIYAVSAILLILTLSFSFNYVIKFKESSKQRQVILLTESIQSAINSQSKTGFGSDVERSIAVPVGVNSICFTDNSKRFDKFSNGELTTQIDNYPEENMFFMPLEEFNADKIENFELDESPLCIKAVDGKVRLKLTSKFGTTNIAPITREHKINKECTCDD